MAKVFQFIASPLSIIDKDLGTATQAVGLIVLGAATGNFALVAAGVARGASLFEKGPGVSTAQTDRLTASVDPRAFRKTVLGQTAMPVDIRYEEWSGKDQEYCDWIVLHASHAIDGLEEIWFDTEMAWSATTGVVGKYAGYFSVPHIVLEGSPANAFTVASGKWNAASARLTGCAYSHWRFKVSPNGKRTTSPFANGLPSRITVIGRGAKLYDPRRDSSVPGGSGPMRADDQSTWRYTADDGAVIGENLPLHALRVVLGWRIRNPATGEMVLATGSGVPACRLNLASWITAANLADEPVNRSAGGTEPRYHGASVVSEGDDPKSTLDMICTGCCGRFRDTGGRLTFDIAHNDLAIAATDVGLLDDDVIGGWTWDPDAALETTPNVVRGRYVDATTASLYQMIDYPEVRLPSIDGQDRIFPLDLGVVESPSQAQRIAKQVLQRKQYPRAFTATFDIRAWKYRVGDVVPFTFAPLSFNRRLFRVQEQELGQGGACVMTLTVETAAIYAWDKDDAAPVVGAEPIVYDSRLNPLVLAIADAATTAEWDKVADTNGTRPANNATNSADPSSPFGTGTVGGTVKKLSDVDKAVAASQARQDVLEKETLPAINKAVADAGDRIAATRKAADDGLAAADKKLTDAASRLDGEDAAIRRQVDAVQSEAKGLNSTTDARVTREVATLAEADGALGRRIDSVVAQVSGTDRDLRVEIKRVDDAAVSRHDAIGRTITEVRSTLTSSFALVSRGLNTPLAGRREAGIYNAAGVRLKTFNRGWNVVTWDSDNQITRLLTFDTLAGLYDGGAAEMAAYLNGLPDGVTVTVHTFDEPFTNHMLPALIDAMHRCGAGEGFTSPDWAYRGAYALIGQTGVGRGGGDELYRGTPVGATDAYIDKPFALLKGKPQRVGAGTVVDSQIRQAATTAVNAQQAVANLSTSVDTRFGGVNDTLGRHTSSITALSDADRGFASRASALEASASASSSSAVFNDNFAIWPDGFGLPSRWGYWAAQGNFGTERLSPGRGGGLYCVRTINDVANVESGFWQQIYTAGRGKWVVEVTIDKPHGSLQGAGVTLHGIWNIDFCADPDTNGAVGDSADGEVRSFSKMFDLDGRDTINVHAMHGWSGFGRTILPKAITWHCLRLRPATDGEIKAGKADAALFGAGGVLARIKSSEDTLADLPNRYAAASRTAALEAQVNLAADSGLLRTVTSRIEDRATAIANDKAGAVAQTVQTLRSEYDRTYGQVQQQAGAISGIDGRTSVYWSVTGTTSDGQTKLSLSKQDGSKGLFYVQANVLFDGDLVVNGTLRPKSFDKSSMSRDGRTTWSGSATPAGGQKIQLPGLGLPSVPPVGRFLYEFSSAVSTNAGRREVSTRNGKTAYLDFLADGGLRVRAIDAQGNQYSPRANGTTNELVLATTDFTPNFAVWVFAGNYDSGWIDDGDYYRRVMSATYTVTSYDLRVLWLAI